MLMCHHSIDKFTLILHTTYILQVFIIKRFNICRARITFTNDKKFQFWAVWLVSYRYLSFYPKNYWCQPSSSRFFPT